MSGLAAAARGFGRLRAACAVLLVLGLAGCAAIGSLQEPQVRLANLQLLDSTMFEQFMRVDLRLTNPNDVALHLDGMTFTLEVNGAPFAQGTSNQAVTVPRLGDAVVSVRASTTLFDMARQILALSEKQGIHYRVSGVVYVRGGLRRTIPYEWKGTFDLLPEGGKGQPKGRGT